MEDRCVSCGAIIPEGRQVCESCEKESALYHALVLIKTHINRQNAEIKKLTIDMNAARLGMIAEHERLLTARAEAIKEFAERLKAKERKMLDYDEAGFSCMASVIYTETIDNLVKEMTEGGEPRKEEGK